MLQLAPAPELLEAVRAHLPRPYRGELDDLELDLAACRDIHRGEVDATCLLELLPPPPAGSTTLALTGVDLFLPALTHVFGASRLGERRGVLSWHRLQDPPRLLQQRLLVEAVHELGHSVGLIHCPVSDCAMHRTLWVESIELKRPDYCPGCRETLERLLDDATPT